MDSIKASKPFILVGRASAFALISLLFSVMTGFAQCDKDIVLTCSKTEYLNAGGTLQRTVDETSEIRVTKTQVTIAPDGHDKMIGTITSIHCDWKEPFKKGKTTVEAIFQDDNNGKSTATIVIEGKDGKITCTMNEKEKPDRIIKVSVDTFRERMPSAKQ